MKPPRRNALRTVAATVLSTLAFGAAAQDAYPSRPIRECGCKPGLVFNPATPLDVLEYTLDKLDMVLLMSVNPGFGGQKFIPYVLDKARKVRQMIDARGLDVSLEIDGGVGPANICEVAQAGVDTFVAGSAVFGAAKDSDPNRYDTVIAALRAELARA